MSHRAMVNSPPSSENEHRSATTLRVNSTLPAAMIAIRIMSESVPCLPQMSKAEHFLRENEFVAIGFGMIDAVAHLERIWRIGRVRVPSSARRSDGCDRHACFGEPSQDPGIRAPLGEHLADRADLAAPGGSHAPHL